MKNRGNYNKLVSSIDLLMNELKGGKYPSAYYIFQNLHDIKKDLSSVIDPEIDSAYTKIGPIINSINYELHKLKNSDIKTSSTKLISLFNEAGPIISQCRSHLHFAEKKVATKNHDHPNTSNDITNLKPKTKSKLEKASYIAAIIGTITTIVGVVLTYYLSGK